MKSKYPFILVHGIALKDFMFFKSFGRIEKVLNENGYQAYTATHDAFGTIENNAQQLKDEIIRIMKECNVDKVNIIAHSKGGLDSKYLINNLDFADHVASLTTICTPHKGSPVANFMLKLPNFLKHIMAFFINTFYRFIIKDKHPDAISACKQLVLVEHIEEELDKANEKVYCQSYSAKLKESRHCLLMGFNLKVFEHFKTNVSDGLVSVESSKYANYQGHCLDESISHCQIVDVFSKKFIRKKVYQFYMNHCDNLIDKGF